MEDRYCLFHELLYFSLYQWISISFSMLSIVLIIYLTYSLYFKQRTDSARDAYNIFQVNLKNLNKTILSTINTHKKFISNLGLSNDLFGNPTVPSDLNDKFLDRINISDLNRYYRKNKSKCFYHQFLIDCNFIGSYYESFIIRYYFFSEKFLDFEKEFNKHKVLFAYEYYESFRNKKENPDFIKEYQSIIKNLKNDKDFVNNNTDRINRDKFVEKYISKLIEISDKYIFTESGEISEGNAYKVNRLANDVKSARINMNFVKESMKKVISVEIEKLESILTNINKLI